jgi:hypothetical protein
MTIKKHNWSGWPGAYCLDCGVEHASENALALDWVDVDENGETWKSPTLRQYIEFLDSHCLAEANEDEVKWYKEELERIKVIDDPVFQEELRKLRVE